jgi:3-deoxy-D-arabino-heptulosonate 7-phosphate (DAHP) synthase
MLTIGQPSLAMLFWSLKDEVLFARYLFSSKNKTIILLERGSGCFDSVNRLANQLTLQLLTRGAMHDVDHLPLGSQPG